jgi:hypothetical protein
MQRKQHTVGQFGSRVTSNDIQRHPTTSNDIQRHPSIHPSIHPSHQYSTIHPGHIGMAAYGQLVTGPPGAGKTTYCHGMHQVSLFCRSLQFHPTPMFCGLPSERMTTIPPSQISPVPHSAQSASPDNQPRSGESRPFLPMRAIHNIPRLAARHHGPTLARSQRRHVVRHGVPRSQL